MVLFPEYLYAWLFRVLSSYRFGDYDICFSIALIKTPRPMWFTEEFIQVYSLRRIRVLDRKMQARYWNWKQRVHWEWCKVLKPKDLPHTSSSSFRLQKSTKQHHWGPILRCLETNHNDNNSNLPSLPPFLRVSVVQACLNCGCSPASSSVLGSQVWTPKLRAGVQWRVRGLTLKLWGILFPQEEVRRCREVVSTDRIFSTQMSLLMMGRGQLADQRQSVHCCLAQEL